jgi:hypothetical protein
MEVSEQGHELKENLSQGESNLDLPRIVCSGSQAGLLTFPEKGFPNILQYDIANSRWQRDIDN